MAARIMPRAREELAEFEPLFEIIEETLGFVPTNLFAMANNPELLRAFAGLSGVITGPGVVEAELKRLISFVASSATGSMYCQAHSAHSARRAGASDEKIRASVDFETSPLFDDRERAALRLARNAASLPNGVEDEDFQVLRKYFKEDEILEIVALVSLLGFLNRWNDTLATRLEESPRAFAESALSRMGWYVGKHR